MHKTYLYLALTLLLSLPLKGELTVVVAVNGLDETALKELQPFWPQGGLRLLSEEAYQTSITYDHWLYGGDEALVTLLTGVNPCQHGIGDNWMFSRENRQPIECFRADKHLGIGTNLGYSAENILVPTISDRLRLLHGTTSHIYAIGIEPSTTIVMAGHAANACCWLGRKSSGDTIRWVSTSYYQEGLPYVADQQNISGHLLDLLNRTWTPRMDIHTYLHATDEEKKHGFRYTLSSLSHSSSPLTHLPFSNTAVVDLALDLQQNKKLGESNHLDLLLLQLTVLSPKAQQCSLVMAEQEDMYLSLNQDLGYLIEQLQRRIGRDGLRVIILGLPKLGENSELMKTYNMEIHSLSIDKITALTSTYLMALYGHERWIDGGWGHTIYLNRTLIEQKHLNIETMRRQVADFLMEFDGIRYACPASEAYLHPEMAPSLHKRFVGDVVFLLQGNYTLTSNPSSLTHHSSPIFIWSGNHAPFPPVVHRATELANYIL